jgi:hypothetical protein
MSMVDCRKCGKPIRGEAFGSPSKGYEHPFSCPLETWPEESDVTIPAVVAAEALDYHARGYANHAMNVLAPYLRRSVS